MGDLGNIDPPWIWIARGPDLTQGARVRIVGFEGGTLLVEPLTLLADEGTSPPAKP